MVLITEKCKRTIIQETLPKRLATSEQFAGPKIPAWQQISFDDGKYTATLCATDPQLHKRIKDLKDAYAGKVKAEQIKFPSQPLVKQEATGSHYEKRNYRGRMVNEIVKTYKTVYQPCIPGAKWLEKHINDAYPEPTMDISTGGQSLHLNGNYKPGMIKDFVKHSLKLM